ncbi:MAG: hypothetical protein ACK4FG_00565 [Brevundimonas sp.]
MTRFTPLERAVLEALADELRLELPDLPAQIAAALPGDRRNTGFGFSTLITIDRSRPPPDRPLTGRFGTIHGDLPGLIDPMAFQIDVIGGRLTALHGMTYDEPTEDIEFATVRLGSLFRIDAQGNSVAWEPGVPTDAGPLREPQRYEQPAPTGTIEVPARDSMSPHVTRSRRPVEADPTPPPKAAEVGIQALEALFGKRMGTPDIPEATAEEQTSLVIGAVVMIIVIGLFAVVFLDIPPFFVLIMGGYLISALMRPKGRAALRKAVDLYKAFRAASGR